MSIPSISLLLIEDQTADAVLFQEIIAEVKDIQWQITVTQRLAEALITLESLQFDAIILDLALPDSFGIETLLGVKSKAPATPLIVLSVLNARELAIESISQGAQDYLIKGQFDGYILSRAINYAIERQRIQEILKQQIERERLMARMIERIRQSLNLDEILRITIEEVRHFLKTDRVLIYRCKNQYQGAVIAESTSFQPENRPNNQIEIALQFLTQLSPELESHASDREPDDDFEDWVTTLVNTLLTVPIWIYQENQQYTLWGQLMAYDHGGSRQWQQWEVEFLTHVANQVAIAIQHSEALAERERLANLDGLTGLANRRQLNLTLAKEWQRLAREKKPLSLIMCDVDFFHQYNDSFGYLAGDDCLRTIAHTLKSVCQRSADVAARFGGEEFLLILPNTDLEGALTVAQNLRQQLAAHLLSHPQSTVDEWVTLSIGIASQIPVLDKDGLILLDQAARALREAKRQGRNRIVPFQGEMTSPPDILRPDT